MRYRYAVIKWYDLVDSKRFSIYGFDAMLEYLGIKGGSFLFSHFRIPGKSLDEELVPLISHKDMLSLLKYVPRYKEIKVYVEKHMMEVVFGKGRGVVIEEIMENDEVNEASKTGNRGQSLLLDEHPPWSSGSLSDSDISEHPPWSSESMNEKKNKSLDLSQDPIDMTKEVKAEQEMQEPVYYNFHPLMYDSDYDRSISDEAEENAELFAELDDLLKHFPFLNDELKENVVGVDAPVVAVEEHLERIEHVVDEEIEIPRKRKRENEDESASANVLPFWKDQTRGEKLTVRCQERQEQMMEMQRFLSGSNVVVESFKLLKELQDDELEKSREMIKLISETQLKVLKKISFITKLHRQ
ncbi:hypothetical protein Tco_0862144 [Tanacetum coccineum]